MHWFLRLVNDGNIGKVARALRNAFTISVRNELLCHENDRGFNAGRMAVENNNEEMLDLLLQYMTHFQLTKRAECDGMCVIQRAVQLKPAWFAKFKSDKPVTKIEKQEIQTMLHMLVEVEDIDNEEKYQQLWQDIGEVFRTMHLKAAAGFIGKSLAQLHVNMPLRLFETCCSSLKDPELLVELVRISIEFENESFFKHILRNVPKYLDIFPLVLEGKKFFIQYFFESGRSLTRDDFQFCVHRNAILYWDLADILAKDKFFEPVKIPKYISARKFGVLLEAGFFLDLEKQLNRDSPFVNLGDSRCKGVPHLAALAVTTVREQLLLVHKKNLKHLSQHLLLDLPDVVRDQIACPFTDRQVKRIWEHVESTGLGLCHCGPLMQYYGNVVCAQKDACVFV